MKKSLAILALAAGISSAHAQDLTSKKGEPILPEEKDWSIGVDATPFLNYMGNFFGKTANNAAPAFNFLNFNQTITGKYFIQAQTAYRASLRLGLSNSTVRENVRDRSYVPPATNTYPNTTPVVENSWTQASTNVGLTAGIEKRRGKTRLQGYYGAEAGLNFSTSNNKFTYGNALVPTGTLPVIVDADDNISGGNVVGTVSQLPGMIGDARVTRVKTGASVIFGVRAFIGAEYFILPKISIGGEFGWGIGIGTGGKTTTTYESIGNTNALGAANQVGTTTVEQPGTGGLFIDTDNSNSIFGPSASLRLNFHF